MRIGGRILRLALVTVIALLVAPTIAAAEATAPPPTEGLCAEPCFRPDGLIRRPSESVPDGGDIYNVDGVGQTRTAVIARGATARFVVRLENDGNGVDDLVVQGTRSATYFRIRYFVGTQEISTRVRNGTYRFSAVPPGGRRAVNVEVLARNNAPLRSKVVGRLAVRSGAEPTTWDRPKFVVYRSQGIETPIAGRAYTGQATAERWARNEAASLRFRQNAALYWELAPPRGIRPEVAYAQSANETGYGRFGGVIDASFHNPCGLKTTVGGGNDDPNAHMRFVNWRQGVTACIDHLALYAGAPGYPRASTPDPRHFDSVYATAPTVERLGGHWAPDPGYGRSIVREYLNPLLGS